MTALQSSTKQGIHHGQYLTVDLVLAPFPQHTMLIRGCGQDGASYMAVSFRHLAEHDVKHGGI